MKKLIMTLAIVGLILQFPLLAEAKGGKKDGKQDKAFQKGIKNLQQQIDDIQLTPGPPGPPGPAGAASTVSGPAGPPGPAGAASTVPGPAGPAGFQEPLSGLSRPGLPHFP